jgi:hypothetical protein
MRGFMRDITAHPGRGRGYIVNLYLNFNLRFKKLSTKK